MTELPRADRRLTLSERSKALAHLEALAWQLNAAADWLARLGVETEADMCEQAARSVLAACWLLSRPFRAQLPPDLWRGADQGERQPGGGQTVPQHPSVGPLPA